MLKHACSTGVSSKDPTVFRPGLATRYDYKHLENAETYYVHLDRRIVKRTDC